jgi:hypothetical protein
VFTDACKLPHPSTRWRYHWGRCSQKYSMLKLFLSSVTVAERALQTSKLHSGSKELT